MAEEIKPEKKELGKGARKNIRRAMVASAVVDIDGAIVHNRMEAAKKIALVGVAVSTGTVTGKDVSQKISSTGTIATKDIYSITSLVPSGMITKADFEIGGHVVKDQILYRFDSALMASDIENAGNAFSRVRKALTNVQADLSNTQSKHGDGVYKVTRAGYMTKAYVTDSEKIGAGSSLVDLTDETTMNVRIPFLPGETELIRIGNPATSALSDTMEQIEGAVIAVGAQEKALSGGRPVRGMMVSFKDPGGITSSTTVNVVINGFRCVEEGKFEAQLSSSITADLGSAVDSVNILMHVGDYIQPGTPVFTMTAKSVRDALQGYSDEVDAAESNVESAQKASDSAKEALNNYAIKSPIDSEVTTRGYKVGDKIGDAGVSDGQLATTFVTIYDMSSYNFKMTIDETDVSRIQLGQRVETTAGALPGETFSGAATNINLRSTSQNDVSTCPVQVTLDSTEKLLPGININTKILVGSAGNTLCIPTDALLRNNKVYVRDPSVIEVEGTVPAGFREGTMEIDLINADKVQITSGNLKEGDEVYVQSKVTDSGMMMVNGRAAEGNGDSGTENAEGDEQQSGGDQGDDEDGQGQDYPHSPGRSVD